MTKRKRRSIQPGLPPGSLTAPLEPAAAPATVRVIDYARYSFEANEYRDGTPHLGRPSNSTHRWIRIIGTPSVELLEQLGSALGIDRMVLEDIANGNQRVKVESYPGLLFTVLRHLRYDPDALEVDERQLSLILTDRVLISVEDDDAHWAEPVVARLANDQSRARASLIDYLYYALVDLAVDRLFPCVDELESSAENLERAISDDAREEHLSQIHRLRGQANRTRSIIWSTRDVVSRLERGESPLISETTAFFMRDVADHVLHLLDSTSMLRETATGLMELYLSRVSNRMNEVMKVLTIISTVFIPITFIAGIYGMNFAHMPELAVGWAYPVVLGVMALIAGAMLLFFKRKKWF